MGVKKTPAPTAATLRVVGFLKRVGMASVDEIAVGAFIAKTTLTGGGYLRQLRQGTIYIQAWRFRPDRVGNGAWQALYGLGNLEDAPRPPVDRAKMNPPVMQMIVQLLDRAGPMTLRRIARFAGLSICTARRHLTVLHAVQKRVHVATWKRGAYGDPAPVFKAGEGEDAPRPAPMARIEIQRRHRAKVVAEKQALIRSLHEQIVRKAA